MVDTSDAERNRFCITDEEVMALAKQALIIEQHYGRPMDIEWAKDGQDGKLYIVQARPETVRSRQEANTLERFALKQTGKVLIEGAPSATRLARVRPASSPPSARWMKCSPAMCWSPT